MNGQPSSTKFSAKIMIAVGAAVAVAIAIGIVLINRGGDTSGGSSRVEEATLVASWTQQDFDRDELDRPFVDEPVIVMADQDELARFKNALPSDAAAGLDTIELNGSTVLVASSYYRCMEYGQILRSDTPGVVEFDIAIAPEDRNTNCAWSPLNVEVWSVPVSALGVDTASEVTSS